MKSMVETQDGGDQEYAPSINVHMKKTQFETGRQDKRIFNKTEISQSQVIEENNKIGDNEDDFDESYEAL